MMNKLQYLIELEQCHIILHNHVSILNNPMTNDLIAFVLGLF